MITTLLEIATTYSIPHVTCFRYDVNIHHRDNKRYSVTIYGAISHAIDGKLCYMFGRSTNAKEYIKFLRYCNSKIKSDVNSKDCIMLYDGAPAHVAKRATKVCDSLYSGLRNIAHSSDFNAIVSIVIS